MPSNVVCFHVSRSATSIAIPNPCFGPSSSLEVAFVIKYVVKRTTAIETGTLFYSHVRIETILPVGPGARFLARPGTRGTSFHAIQRICQGALDFSLPSTRVVGPAPLS